MNLSIIIPIYNRAEWVSSLVEHCQELSTIEGVEIIIVNDGSRDETFQKLQAVAPEHWVLINQGNAGAAAARQHGFAKSSGRYIQFLDSDDKLDVAALEQRLQFLDSHLDADVVYGSWIMGKDESSAKSCTAHENEDMVVDLLLGKWNPNFSYLYRRKVVEKSGGWNAESGLNDDFEFALRVAASGARFTCLRDCVTGLYRWHPGERLSRQSDVNNALATYPILESVYQALGKKGGLSAARENAFAHCAWKLAKASFLESREAYQRGKELTNFWDSSVISNSGIVGLIGLDGAVRLEATKKMFWKSAKKTIKSIIKRA